MVGSIHIKLELIGGLGNLAVIFSHAHQLWQHRTARFMNIYGHPFFTVQKRPREDFTPHIGRKDRV